MSLLNENVERERVLLDAGFEPDYDAPGGAPLMWKRGRTRCTMREAFAIIRAEQS